jgi:hypothetical protein
MFSLRQIFLIIGIVSVISLVVSLGLAGQGWAMGVAIGAFFLTTVFVVMVLVFFAIDFYSRLRSAIETPQLDEFSPFRAEQPAKMPELPQSPNLEQMIPGWESLPATNPSQAAGKPPVAQTKRRDKPDEPKPNGPTSE